jgi:enoyl-CoA hydratase/carnithine racemase
MAGDVVVERREGAQLLRLSRSAKKNALTGAMYEALMAALDDGDRACEVAAHVLIGSDGVFSAGNDIADFLAASRAGQAGIPLPALAFIRRLPRLKKPLIAAVDGLAIGVGTTLAFHCDLVYATPAASFRTPFLDLALVPEAASSLAAVQRMGHARAFELLCLGNAFDAGRALAAGLVNAIVPAAELEATALDAARRLAAKPPEALAAARRLMRGDGAALAVRIEEEADIFRARMQSAEAREAFAAFLEKRPPNFSREDRR